MRSEEEIRARLADFEKFMREAKRLQVFYEYPRTEREIAVLKWVLNDKEEK